MESRLEYDTIVHFRELGEALWEVRHAEAEQVEQQVRAESGWLGRVWGTATTEKQRVLDQEMVITGGLLQSIGRELQKKRAMAEENDPVPKDFVKVFFDFELKRVA
jgi:galactokinase